MERSEKTLSMMMIDNGKNGSQEASSQPPANIQGTISQLPANSQGLGWPKYCDKHNLQFKRCYKTDWFNFKTNRKDFVGQFVYIMTCRACRNTFHIMIYRYVFTQNTLDEYAIVIQKGRWERWIL